jgi:hypothetical protein
MLWGVHCVRPDGSIRGPYTHAAKLQRRSLVGAVKEHTLALLWQICSRCFLLRSHFLQWGYRCGVAGDHPPARNRSTYLPQSHDRSLPELSLAWPASCNIRPESPLHQCVQGDGRLLWRPPVREMKIPKTLCWNRMTPSMSFCRRKLERGRGGLGLGRDVTMAPSVAERMSGLGGLHGCTAATPSVLAPRFCRALRPRSV